MDLVDIRARRVGDIALDWMMARPRSVIVIS